MASPSEYYVNSETGSNVTGSGAVGNPWLTIQHALDTITRDATNGDRMNVITPPGFDMVLPGLLDIDGVGKYGSPSATAPLIIQGATATAGDGGIAEIDCNTLGFINDNAVSSVHLIDLHLFNGGSATLVELDNDCLLARCELEGTTGTGYLADFQALVMDCHFHNLGGFGCRVAGGLISHCYFKDEANTFSTAAIHSVSSRVFITHNLIHLTAANIGMNMQQQGAAFYNSILSTGAGSTGINSAGSNNDYSLFGNLIDISGSGSTGISVPSTDDVDVYGGNSVYASGSATAFSIAGDVRLDLGNNTSLSSSPFRDAASGDFRPLPGFWNDPVFASFRGAASVQKLMRGAVAPLNIFRPLEGLAR